MAINLFNIDRLKFIPNAPVKNQCSQDYFYGHDLRLERALQPIESAYAQLMSNIGEPGYSLMDNHRTLLRQFWLLQHVRTEAASVRAAEMFSNVGAAVDVDANEFRLSISEAIQDSMSLFPTHQHAIDDLKICLLHNRTRTPFVTSDDPAILTNRWALERHRTMADSFGLHTAGALLLLPLSPRILCVAYDGDVYSLPHNGGWVDIRCEVDVRAFNQHQYLNCRANIFVQDDKHADIVRDEFLATKPFRPHSRDIVHYAVFDGKEGDVSTFRVVGRESAGNHQRAMIHSQVIHAKPSMWPKQISRRTKSKVYTNGTGLGYVREDSQSRRSAGAGFRKESAW